ncbi:MAG: hypothetical protein ACREDK_08315 [Thermoplasmata archaeon]
MPRAMCRAAGCGKDFRVPSEAIAHGYAATSDEWRFLAICPSCGTVYEYCWRGPRPRQPRSD